MLYHSSGLDSVSSMSVARALLTVARSGRTVACVVHQPSSQMFNSADDIILLSNGRTIYSGALADIPDTLAKAGFVCPQYYNMADYSKCPIGIPTTIPKKKVQSSLYKFEFEPNNGVL